MSEGKTIASMTDRQRRAVAAMLTPLPSTAPSLQPALA
jgi:hypothetical protein